MKNQRVVSLLLAAAMAASMAACTQAEPEPAPGGMHVREDSGTD